MQKRQPLVNGQIYHVFNRGQNHQPTFTNSTEYRRAVEALHYYLFNNTVSLSRFLVMNAQDRHLVIAGQNQNKPMVGILAYCLMPNHFHLLLQQNTSNGISTFLSQFQNSFTRYYNAKHSCSGTLFHTRFKSVRIETATQLTHVSRYIHLNPYTSHAVSTIDELWSYPWSSLPEYLKLRDNSFTILDPILDSFSHNTESYKQFILDRADYQRRLKADQHLLLEANEDALGDLSLYNRMETESSNLGSKVFNL